MDARTKNQHTNPALPRLRIGALALAIATLPAIGIGIHAQEVDAGNATVETATTMPAPAPAPLAATTPAEPPLAVQAPYEPAPVEPMEPAPIETLEPGEYLWNPEVSPHGDVAIVVSLPEQRLHVYRNGLRIGVSTISSGKPGHETPTGTYPILQKRVEHYSNLYDNAPMPHMQRLTWDGIALHAGRIPGHPASHGCVRLPAEFAEILYDVTRHGTVVVVADDSSHSASVVYPGPELPVDPHSGMERASVDVAALVRMEDELAAF